MQSALGTLGYYEGAADGVFDGSTRLAVRRFQQAHGLEETGLADEALQALLFGGSAIPAPQPTQYIPRFPGAGRMDSPPLAAQVLYADWDSDVSRSFQAGQTVTLYDFQTGLAWQARLGEAGAAADAEPVDRSGHGGHVPRLWREEHLDAQAGLGADAGWPGADGQRAQHGAVGGEHSG